MSIYQHLSYAMDKKTDKIIGLKRELGSQEKFLPLLYIVFFFTFVYCCINYNNYINYFYNYFTHKNINFNLKLLLDIIEPAIAIYLLSLINSLKNKTSVIKQIYDKLRLDIIDTIDNEFCHHIQSCSCKDDYIRDMKENYNIDLVFK